MEEFRFKGWKVYEDAQCLFSDVLKITKNLPPQYRFNLADQLKRSSLSIVLNIAEGSGKASDAELARFLNIAIGSVYETVAGLDTLCRNNLLGPESQKALEIRLLAIARQLGGLKKKASAR